MSVNISLPHYLCVSKWKEEKVIKWLKKVHLDDCIPAFEMRHIDGSKLLELNEQKLFTFQDLKIKRRKQIEKCVRECKSQASNAKRIAKTLKQNHGTDSQSEPNGACESEEDSDDWGSDFEDDSEDEVIDEKAFPEVNNNTIIQPVPGTVDKHSISCSALSTDAFEEKSIPQPPDIPIISKPVNGSSGFKNSLTNSIPRPPLKRPPSQPPPPPIPQATSQEPQEDYEIPIISTSSYVKGSFSFSDSTFPSSTLVENSMLDTYEIVEPPEENYEVVDSSSIPLNMAEKPLLPPRHLKSPESVSPPPLPQKPLKLKDNFSGTERLDGVRTFSRPKLPVKTETDTQAEVNQPSPLPTNVGFISSLIGRKPNLTPSLSPKIQHKSKDSNDCLSSSPISTRFMNNSFSSSSPPDKEGSPLLEGKKMLPLPPLPPRGPLCPLEDSVQNMATRPLPPVPAPKEDEKTKKLQDVLNCPWFHEIEREDAELAIKKLNEEGSFVVRPSKRAGKENPFTLTVLHEDKLFHLNIRQRPDNKFALGKEKEKETTFGSVSELINFHLSEPILLKNRGESAGMTILCKYPEKT